MSEIKFQYIRDNDLCITIGTEIVDSDKYSHVFWAVSFKHPKDKFSKNDARNAVLSAFEHADFTTGELIFKRGQYTRHEIVLRIMMELYLSSGYISDTYIRFVTDELYLRF